MGVSMYHWVTEWQKRGVPHLHGMFYFDRELDVAFYNQLKIHWLECALNVTGHLPAINCQTVKPVHEAVGWVQYLGKHGSRGLHHYQRANKPTSWEKTGRMWGKGGNWPIRTSEGEISLPHFHKLRRLTRRWRIADARSEKDPKARARRIVSARNMLKKGLLNISRVQGLSEWIPEHLALLMLYATETGETNEAKS